MINYNKILKMNNKNNNKIKKKKTLLMINNNSNLQKNQIKMKKMLKKIQ